MDAKEINEFWATFTALTLEIRSLYMKISANQVYAEIAGLRQKIAELQEYSNVSTTVLPVYDIKRSQQEISILLNQCNELELLLQPRQKFRFSDYTMKNFILKTDGLDSKIDGSLGDTNIVSVEELIEIANSRSRALELEGSYAITNQSNSIFDLCTENMCSSSNSQGLPVQLLISQCHNITVSVRGVLGSIRIENCSNCHLFLGPCSTSCYIESVTNSVVCCSSHQLRIHNTHDSILYVRTHSHPIIEDCSYLGFAQYRLLDYNRPSTAVDSGSNACNMTLQQDNITAGLVTAQCWSNVVDFKWHKETVSPNYYLISIENKLHYPHIFKPRSIPESSESLLLPIDQPVLNMKPTVTVGQQNSHNSNGKIVLPCTWSIDLPRSQDAASHSSKLSGSTGQTAVSAVSAASLNQAPVPATESVNDEDEDEI